MEVIEKICKKNDIARCYLFGYQKKTGKEIMDGKKVKILDENSDIDFGVLFRILPEDPIETYARLSLEFMELVSLFEADLLFLHEVDHLIQLEVITGINIYSVNESFQEKYEEKVMMFASDELEIFKLNEKDRFL